MAQNKTRDFVLLLLVFAASVAAGWFLSGSLFNDDISVTDRQEQVMEDQAEDVIEEFDEAAFEEEIIEDVEVAEEEVVQEEVIPEEPKLKVYEEFTSEQMEDLINSGDFGGLPATFDTKNIFRATNKNIVVRNLRPGDAHPDDVVQLCGKVADGFWKEVTDTRVYANEQNIITRIEVTVVYPDNQESYYE